MSKYVPAFVKQQQAQGQQQSNSSIWNRGNRFSALSDDFPMNNRDKPFGTSNIRSDTTRPDTMASLTSSGNGFSAATSVATGGGNKSFASKFSEQMRRAENPNYVPPPKPLDINSQEDFPSLGAKPSKSSVTPVVTPNKTLPGAPLKPNTIRQTVMSEQPTLPSLTKPSGNKWASMAKAWAQKDEDERNAERERELKEEEERKEMELLNLMHRPTFMHNRHCNDYDEEEEDDYDQTYNQDEADSYYYESSETDDMPSDSDKQDGEDAEGEYNSNTVWDGRRKDDLY